MANGDQTYNTQVNQFNKTFKYYYMKNLPEYIKISYEIPQNMWGWTDTRFLQSIQLYKSKKQCIKEAIEYLEEVQK